MTRPAPRSHRDWPAPCCGGNAWESNPPCRRSRGAPSVLKTETGTSPVRASTRRVTRLRWTGKASGLRESCRERRCRRRGELAQQERAQPRQLGVEERTRARVADRVVLQVEQLERAVVRGGREGPRHRVVELALPHAQVDEAGARGRLGDELAALTAEGGGGQVELAELRERARQRDDRMNAARRECVQGEPEPPQRAEALRRGERL